VTRVRGWLRTIGVVLTLIGVALLVSAAMWAEGAGAEGADAAATSPVDAALRAAHPAVKPFRGLTATRVEVGKRTLDVVIADSERERVEGLRRRRTIGRYDGMLFVYPSATTATYTMSTVPVSLDIAFYDGSGRVVHRVRMTPCAGTDVTCPTYPSGGRFRYALETLRGRLPHGRLRSPA
jgi:uncharacterized membrane protein (UPF0127 family)